ncbi:inositol 2-dehydrogenase [Propionibacterium australiense]|uniref:Inositol 2-dehydrogenase n=1 Tax=Propionibacterium australiense TaxID=119981 RepID=A0A383S396_9ACTN|nr:inositol 2-dehydrogenase [Propionibacterium australiense]RLP11473.1 inositol 2-dehydrogenase [Propionibacterium australiense]RLP12790.1 inositol 2-dehydrogenase [Propionibacterium australiense]SYZ32171.1 Oxidoreductase family, C-terminal alpha/beta domain [Propionibacterium australiense]VEH90756.1 Inositol 2-dehydrogenase [Propionibacterium australiense]
MLNIAVIGAGRIGHVHARTIAGHPEARLALVCDPIGDAAEKLASTHGARAAKDAEEAFADPQVDAVIVGSPTPLHIPHLIAAAKAGKAVLCEKPIALDMADVEAAQADLDAITTPVMFGFNRRFDPSFAAVRAAVQAGRIGALEQLTIISRDPAAPPIEYVKVSGGIFRDMTIHDFDTARFFLGDIVELHAVGQNLDPAIKEAGDFDAAVVTLKAASGAVATIINNRHCASGYDQRLEASGRDGALFAENIRGTTVRLSNAEVTDAQEPYLDFFLERYADAYRLELSAFIEAVEAGTTPPTGITDAVEALRLAEAATTSARTGEVVRLVS